MWASGVTAVSYTHLTDRPLAEAYQLALLDLDGVVYRGKNPVEYLSLIHI